MTITDRFQAGVLAHLEPLSDQLIEVLKRMVSYNYPPQVQCIHFEVFWDSFRDGFPVRAFFLDAEGNEFFVFRGENAEYPCDVDPGLLDLEQVYSEEFEESFVAEDEDLDIFGLSGSALVPWFARCWQKADDVSFKLGANIGLHDKYALFDLIAQKWLD